MQMTRTAHKTGLAAATYSKSDWAAETEDSAVVAEVVAAVVDSRHTSGTDMGSRTTHSSPTRRPANWLSSRTTRTRCSWPLPAIEAKRSSWACLALNKRSDKSLGATCDRCRHGPRARRFLAEVLPRQRRLSAAQAGS